MNQNVFQTDRARLFSIAYRMLGSAADAEDVLQDGWLRFESADRERIRSPQAFATTIVTRLCLDRLKSARATREEYIGTWLPEPVLTSDVDGPETRLQRSESVTLAFLVLLETLTPEERAVLLLKDVFDYDHVAIAEILDMSPDNSRQLLHRAKARIAQGRPRLSGTPESRRAVAERFARAFVSGDADRLVALLADDVGLWSDGGGKAIAARRPILGRDSVVNMLVGLERSARANGMANVSELKIEEVNAEPALVLRVAGRLESIFVLSIAGETVTGIRVVRNPDKLDRINRQLTSVH
jgi:RNA polymerase sigma-70 factor (ECF subfamily)